MVGFVGAPLSREALASSAQRHPAVGMCAVGCWALARILPSGDAFPHLPGYVMTDLYGGVGEMRVFPPSVSFLMMVGTKTLQHGATIRGHRSNTFMGQCTLSFLLPIRTCLLLGQHKSVWCDPGGL